MAEDLAQSVSSILHSAIPSPPKQHSSERTEEFAWKSFTLPSSDAERVMRHVRAMNERAEAFLQVPDLKRAAAVLLGYTQTNPDEKILILAPTIRDVQQMKTYMSGMNPIVITSKDTNNQRWNKWHAWRSKTQGVLIGTRFAALLIDESITSILLIKSGDSSHKNKDRNPRYDTRRLVRAMQTQFNTKKFSFDTVPSTDDLLHTNKIHILDWHDSTNPVVVDLNQERGQTSSSLLSHTVLEHIWNTRQEGTQALCILNKKGHGNLRICKDCQYRFSCTNCQTSLRITSHLMICPRCRTHNPIKTTCPGCQSANLIDIGWGNANAAKELKQLFPNAHIQICDAEHTERPVGDILIVTQWWLHNHFNPFEKTTLGAVIDLNADLSLHNGSPRAIEQVLQSLWIWRGVATQAQVPYVIQAASTPLIRAMLDQPHQVLSEELETYKSYQLPPYTRIVQISYKDSEKRKIEMALSQLQIQVEKTLPTASVNQTILPNPTTKQPQLTLEITIPTEEEAKLLTLFTGLSDHYIIDTDAFSR